MQEHEHHGPSYRNYIMIYVALAVLTAATVALSGTSLGPGVRTFLAFAIATVKTLLVALIFMHLKFEKSTLVVFAIVPVVLAIFFILATSPDIGIVAK